MYKNELKLHRCCFTGHRPAKLAYSENEIKLLLENAIDNAIAAGFVTFITGMAMGVDIWAAEIVLEKRKNNGCLHLICAVPHPDFEKRRNEFEQKRYKNIIENADYVTTVCGGYFNGVYQVRNKFMVDRSNLVIAVWNGAPSGTKNTVDYAVSKGVRVINVLNGKM